MKRILGSVGLSGVLLLAGCKVPGVGVSTASTSSSRLTGQWKNTLIQVQKYDQAAFVNKTTGQVIEPIAAETMPTSQVDLQAATWEELTYGANGRLRYAAYTNDPTDQPYVVEQDIAESDFETLDTAFYTDGFFQLKSPNNWDPSVRFPLFRVSYVQNNNAYMATFTPTLGKLPNVNKLMTNYFGELSGTSAMASGTSQVAYYITANNGQLDVRVATVTPDANGNGVESHWSFVSAQYDTGSGPQNATLDSDKHGFTLPQPQSSGNPSSPFTLIGVTMVHDGQASYSSIIPVRVKS